jgi:hypothetical protein
MTGDRRPAHFTPKTIGEAYEVIMIGAQVASPSSMLVNL